MADDPKANGDGGVAEYQIPSGPLPGNAPLPPLPKMPTPSVPAAAAKPATTSVSAPLSGAPAPSPPPPQSLPPVNLPPLPASPAQPLPSQTRQVLETKAKQVINEWDTKQELPKQETPKPKRKLPVVPIMVIGLISLSAVGLGIWGGLRLLTTPESAEIGSEASMYPKQAVEVICNKNNPEKEFVVLIQAIGESPVCNTEPRAVCPETPVETSSYETNYRITMQDRSGTNNVKEVKVRYKTNSNWCTDPCGQKASGVCHDNSVVEELGPVTIERNKSYEVTISRTADVGQACGSFQTDLKLTNVSDCPDFDWPNQTPSSLCYTGLECPDGGTPPTPTPTPAPPASCNNSCNQNSDCSSGLECVGGLCRNPECQEEADCVCQVAEPLVCDALDMSPASAQIGTDLTFTCSGRPAAGTRGEFQMSRDGGAYTPLSNLTTTTAGITVDSAGMYAVRCRWCQGDGDAAQCTPWQSASQGN